MPFTSITRPRIDESPPYRRRHRGVTQNDHATPIRRVVFRDEITTQHRVRAERLEVLPTDAFAAYTLGVAFSKDGRFPAPNRCRRFDRLRRSPNVRERLPPHPLIPRAVGAALVRRHEPLRMRKRKTPNQHRVHHTEDRRRGPDRDAKRQHTQRREPARSAEYAKSLS
jgi:hypothetical protein